MLEKKENLLQKHNLFLIYTISKKIPNPTAEEMDQADEELKVTITHIWPLQAAKILDLLVPRKDTLNKGKFTVGKVYAGLLILESWRNTRFGQIDSGLPVSLKLHF